MFLSLIVAVLGLLVYVLATNSKVSEVGRIALLCGLLTFLLHYVPGALTVH